MRPDLRQEEAEARNKIHLCLLSLANSHGNKQLTTNDSNMLAKILLVFCWLPSLTPSGWMITDALHMQQSSSTADCGTGQDGHM